MKIVPLRWATTHVTEKDGASPCAHVDLEDVEGAGSGRWLTRADPDRTGEALQVRAGDVLYARLRPNLRKTFIADRDLTASTEFLVVRPRSSIDSRFLGYVLRDVRFSTWAIANAYGTKMPRVGWNTAGHFPVMAAELDVQRAVADFLDRECKRIEQLRRHAEHVACDVASFESALLGEVVNRAGAEFGTRRLMQVTEPRRPIMYGIVLPGPDVTDGVPLVKGGDVDRGRLSPELLRRSFEMKGYVS